MPLVAFATRAARRTLDVLLLLLIAVVLAILVLPRVLPPSPVATTFVVGGPSMEPTIPFGSAVHAEPVAAADLRVGDVVSLQRRRQHAVFTHRITRVVTLPDGMYLETKGDAQRRHPDPSLVPGHGRPWPGLALACPSSASASRSSAPYQGVMFLIALRPRAARRRLAPRDHRGRAAGVAMRRAARQALAAFAPEAPAEPQAAG